MKVNRKRLEMQVMSCPRVRILPPCAGSSGTVLRREFTLVRLCPVLGLAQASCPQEAESKAHPSRLQVPGEAGRKQMGNRVPERLSRMVRAVGTEAAWEAAQRDKKEPDGTRACGHHSDLCRAGWRQLVWTGPCEGGRCGLN